MMVKKSEVKNDEESFETLMDQIAKKLKKLRIESGYKSYENFAWDNGINRMQYWKMEKGTTNFTMKSLYKVLKVHDINFADFFKDFE